MLASCVSPQHTFNVELDRLDTVGRHPQAPAFFAPLSGKTMRKERSGLPAGRGSWTGSWLGRWQQGISLVSAKFQGSIHPTILQQTQMIMEECELRRSHGDDREDPPIQSTTQVKVVKL